MLFSEGWPVRFPAVKKVETETNKFDLTDEETEETRHRKSFITSGVSFGFGFPVGDSSYSDVDNLKLLSWNIRYEAGKYVVENALGVSWGSTDVTVDTLNDTKESKGVFYYSLGYRFAIYPGPAIRYKSLCWSRFGVPFRFRGENRGL